MKHPDYCDGCKKRRKSQCTATEIAIDLPAPDYCHCQKRRGHKGQHECEHGFHWGEP